MLAFGGKCLQVISAEEIANRLRKEDIPLFEVEKAGYPREIVELGRNVMAGHGVVRVEDWVVWRSGWRSGGGTKRMVLHWTLRMMSHSFLNRCVLWRQQR